MNSTVLIVDDLAFMRTAIRDILENNGISVIAEAENGRDGVRALSAYKPDIVILDITMPIMDGLTALEYMRKVNPNSKVIMCSSIGQQQAVIRSIQLGAKDFVVKPFTPSRLLSAIRRAMGSG